MKRGQKKNTKPSRLFVRSPAWEQVLQHIGMRKSSVVYAPRYYGKRLMLDRLAAEEATTLGLLPIQLSSEPPVGMTRLSYKDLWASTIRQLGRTDHAVPRTTSEYAALFRDVVSNDSRRVMVLIRGAGRANVEFHFALLSLFDGLLQDLSGRIIVVAVDDYALEYERINGSGSSDWVYYEKVHYGHFAEDQCRHFLEILSKSGSVKLGTSPARLAKQWYEVTGGHPGLGEEILELTQSKGYKSLADVLNAYKNSLHRNSNILSGLSRLLHGELASMAEPALEYQTPRFAERNQPHIPYLLQLGILRRCGLGKLELCPGLVSEIVREVAKGCGSRDHLTKSRPLSAGISEAPANITDEDFVVVHMSDLHVGPKYRFRLLWDGAGLNADEPCVADLVRRDVEQLGLKDRIDALVLSGDFVCEGTPEEFSRARDILHRILEALTLDLDRLVLVPGNHDVCWSPGPMVGGLRSNGSTLEHYNEFLRTLKNEDPGSPNLLDIVSRGGGSALQIVGLDSNSVEGPDAPGVGFVSPQELEHMTDTLHAQVRAIPRTHRWVAFHHHLFAGVSATRIEASKLRTSVLANAPTVFSTAVAWGAELVLHGHQHQPMVTISRHWPADNGRQFCPLVAVGAGSIGVNRDQLGPFSRNHYFIICRRVDDIVIYSRWLGDSGMAFVHHANVQISDLLAQAPDTV